MYKEQYFFSGTIRENGRLSVNVHAEQQPLYTLQPKGCFEEKKVSGKYNSTT